MYVPRYETAHKNIETVLCALSQITQPQQMSDSLATATFKKKNLSQHLMQSFFSFSLNADSKQLF
jgi:hypothetical protein